MSGTRRCSLVCDRPRPWRLRKVFFKKKCTKSCPKDSFEKNCMARRLSTRVAWSKQVVGVPHSDRNGGHHRHTHTTFHDSSTLVSEQTLVAPYNSVSFCQHVPLRDRTPTAHTAYTCYMTETSVHHLHTGPQKRVTLHLGHVAKTGPQLTGRNPQIGR